MSSLKDFNIINPYKEKDIKYLKDYCYKYNQQELYREISSIKYKISEEDYNAIKEIRPVIEELYYQKNEIQITSLTKVTIAKDIKSAQIELFATDYNIKNTIINLSQLILQNNNIENVYIFINRQDKRLMHNLIENGFIALISEGESEEYIPFMLEKDLEKESRIHI